MPRTLVGLCVKVEIRPSFCILGMDQIYPDDLCPTDPHRQTDEFDPRDESLCNALHQMKLATCCWKVGISSGQVGRSRLVPDHLLKDVSAAEDQ